MIHHRLAHHPTLVDQWHLQLSTLLLFIVVDRKLNLDGPVGGKKETSCTIPASHVALSPKSGFEQSIP